MTRYFVLIEENLGAYSLTVPDLPGCTSAGSTIGEVLHNAAEDVRRWITDAGIDPHPRLLDARAGAVGEEFFLPDGAEMGRAVVGAGVISLAQLCIRRSDGPC